MKDHSYYLVTVAGVKGGPEVLELEDSEETLKLVAPSAPYLESESFVEIRVELAKQLNPLQAVTKAGIRPVEGIKAASKVQEMKEKRGKWRILSNLLVRSLAH